MQKDNPHMNVRKSNSYKDIIRKNLANVHSMVRPLSLVMVLTSACNTKCIYCPYQLGTVTMQRSFLDTDIALKILEEFSLNGGRFVRFSGGEPLLHTGLPKLVERAFNLGLHITLVTNGIELGKDKFDWLTKLSAITLSIDSLDDIVAQEIRGISLKTYEGILEILAEIKRRSSRLWIGANCVISRRNIHTIPDLVKKLSHHKIAIQFQPCHSFGKEENLLEYPHPEDISNLVITLEKMRSEGYLINSSRWYLQHMVNFLKSGELKEDCSAGHFQAIVDTDATIRFCCMLKPIGSLSNKSLYEIWDSEKANIQRSNIKERRCPRCWLMYMDIGHE